MQNDLSVSYVDLAKDSLIKAKHLGKDIYKFPISVKFNLSPECIKIFEHEYYNKKSVMSVKCLPYIFDNNLILTSGIKPSRNKHKTRIWAY